MKGMKFSLTQLFFSILLVVIIALLFNTYSKPSKTIIPEPTPIFSVPFTNIKMK